jgi:hypothetical protein
MTEQIAEIAVLGARAVLLLLVFAFIAQTITSMRPKMSTKNDDGEILLLFREYGFASTVEIAEAVGCARNDVASVVGGHTAGMRDLRVKEHRGLAVDRWIVGRMIARLGGKRRAAA